MEVYQASHGGVAQLERHLSEYTSLETLCHDAAEAADVPVENVLIFLEDGREVRDDIIQEMWEKGEQDGQQTLYLFNRQTFFTDPEEWAAQFQEEISLPPPLNLSAISDLSQAQQPFLIAFDHLAHLHSLFSAQSRAVSIAYANLSHHLAPLMREFESFAMRAEREMQVEEGLIRSAKADLAMLPKVVVHETFLRKKDAMDGSQLPKTLADYVHPRKMEQVRESCQVAHEDHVSRFAQLSQAMDELALQSDAERRAAEDRAGVVQADFEEGLRRIEDALEHLKSLFSADSNFSQHLMELDGAMRDDLVTLTNVKNEFTLDVHIHLRQVATFQTRITELIQPLRTLDTELRSKAAFPHLARLHQLPFAYAATVVEVVRRKEFASFVVDWTTRLADTLVKFTSVEKARRLAIRNDTLSQLPWTVAAIEDTMNPSVDVVVNVGVEALAKVNLGRSDIDNLLAWVESLKGDESLAIDGSDPIAFLQTNLEAMISKIDLAGDELDRMIERSVFMAQDGRVSDQALAAERDAALAHAQEVEEQYERRTQTLQTRQAELQDEVYRLRNDLGEEVDARQALSAQLEERAKEQRDHDDLVAALQADMQQEKDRATDLGTRLQEALIDVDGLRHSEAGLREQIESLQEERSRHLEEINEAQTRSEMFESQLARVRAELESTTEQLAKAHEESRHSSAEAERLRRDHLAEADGDRAVLDQQIFTLTKQLDEANGKMTSARNTAIREANGLKAELSLTQVQLREARRKEAALADELAMARDAAAASSQKEQDADVARDAVVLAGRYHDVCASLLKTINTSSTISGATRSKSPVSGSQHESMLARSLASASAFDLDDFKEAVARAINAARKFGKTAKYWREQARHRISFMSFEDGDLALFLPTRNATTRPWMAFNVSKPHHFLRVPEARQEAWRNRDNIIARITSTQEAKATSDPDTNPFGLADGLTYYIHQVEEYTPAPPRPRRSTSARPEASMQMLASTAGNAAGSMLKKEDLVDLATSPDAAATIPSDPAADATAAGTVVEPSSPIQHIAGTSEPVEPVEPIAEPVSQSSTPPETDVRPDAVPGPERYVETQPEPARLVPVQQVVPSPRRVPSRASPASPPSRETPIFAPSSFGRPASVASSAGSYPKGLPVPPSATAAPAMAISTSNDSNSPFGEFQRRVIRKTSSTASLTPSEQRRPSIEGSPLAGRAVLGEVSARAVGIGIGIGTGTGTGAVSPPKEGVVSGFAALGTSLGKPNWLARKTSGRSTGAPGAAGGTATSAQSGTTAPRAEGKTAMDELRKLHGT